MVQIIDVLLKCMFVILVSYPVVMAAAILFSKLFSVPERVGGVGSSAAGDQA